MGPGSNKKKRGKSLKQTRTRETAHPHTRPNIEMVTRTYGDHRPHAESPHYREPSQTLRWSHEHTETVDPAQERPAPQSTHEPNTEMVTRTHGDCRTQNDPKPSCLHLMITLPHDELVLPKFGSVRF